MKEVIIKKRKKLSQSETEETVTKITTPWLRRTEGAIYCNVSPGFFDRLTRNCPVHGFEGRSKVWHVATLDKLIGAGS